MNVEKELEKIGIKPVRGQNFLNSEPIVNALVESGEVEDKKVLEIGAGTGAITQKLSEKAEKVYAVERNRKLVDHLREKFRHQENVELVAEDILKYEWPEVDRCVSNLPFQISSKLLEKLGEKQIQSSVIVQEELADKIIADPGTTSYGEFTVKINYFFIPVKLRKVGSENFHPEPEVDAAILKLYPNKERHGIQDTEALFQLTHALFTHKRKKVRNAFVDARNILELDKDKAKQVRDSLPNSEKRVNELRIKELNEIAKVWNNQITS